MKNRNFLIIGGMVVITIIAFFLINLFSGPKPDNDTSATVQNLKEEIIQLESSLLDIEVVFQEKDAETEQYEELLQQKYDELAIQEQKVIDLEKQVDELERQGKLDKGTIRDLREKIANAKLQLVDAYKQEIELLVYDNNKLTRDNDSILTVMEVSDSVRLALETEKDRLAALAQDCLNGAVAGNTPDPVSIEPPQPEVVNRFFVDNVRFEQIDGAGGSKESPRRVRTKNLSKLIIKFQLGAEGNMETGGKEVFVVVKSKSTGQVMQNLENGLSDNFSFQGSTLPYTINSLPQFSGGTQNVTMEYRHNGDWPVGPHTVEFYLGNNRIGVHNVSFL